MNILRFDEVESTNELAKEHDANTVLVTKTQTQGRGRFDRVWESAEGGLWCSLVLAPDRDAWEYTFIASLAIKRVVGDVLLVWPNDLYVDKKKLCGILTQVHAEGNVIKKVIVGIGLNVNNTPPSEGVSLADLGKQTDLDQLLDEILKEFAHINKLDTKDLLKLYKDNCALLGKQVKCKALWETIEGKAVDIDSEGNLVLETDSGIKVCEEGDTSLEN